ncbi:MAG: TolC family protein [Clostridium sp.]|nr:TolC family protein [Clostridium sp.]
MKKKLIIFLLAFMTIVNVPSINVYSASLDNVSFTSIRSIMMENSIDMQIAQNKLDSSRQDLKKIKDDIEDIKSDISGYESTKDSLNSELGALDSSSDSYSSDKEEIDVKLDDCESKLDELNDSLDNYENQKEKAQRSLKEAQMTYDKTVENAVYSSQKSYIDYLSMLSDIELKKGNIELKTKEAQTAKLKYDSGFLSKNDYDSADTDTTDLNNELNELKSKEEIALKNLKLSLGINQDSNITLSNDLEADFNAVLSIDYEKDLNEMLENNADIRLLNMQIDWAEDDEEDSDDDDDYEDYSLENNELSLDKKYISTEIDFKEKYNNLINAYNSLKSSYDKVKTKQESYALNGRKYSFGFVSKNDLEQSKLDLDKEESSFNSARNQFYLNYLDYIQMKEGY